MNLVSRTKNVGVKDIKSVLGKRAPNAEQADVSHISTGERDCPARVFIKDFLIKYFEVELKEEPMESKQPKDTPISAMDVLMKAQRSFISFQRAALFATSSLWYRWKWQPFI